ncbi:MAG: hypothetical protein EBU88_00820 [Acidobacteria bacterium]|nr:hypothetical protein [Acidobacteriota bacterium]
MLVIFTGILPDRGGPYLVVGSAPVPLPQPAIPAGLTPPEVNSIQRHRNPKSMVAEALKIAELRLINVLDNARNGRYKLAVDELAVYAALVSYADGVTRAIPSQKRSDREGCLKRIEQALFRQSPRLENVTRELPFDLRDPAASVADLVKRIRLRAINDLLGGGSAIRVPEQ